MMLKRMVFCGFLVLTLLGHSAGDNPQDKRFSPLEIPPISWLETPLRVDRGDPAGAAYSEFPQLAVNGKDVGVVWVDHRNGQGDILFNRSRNRGAAWGADPVRLDTGKPSGLDKWSYDPRILRSRSQVYVVWTDERNGLEDVYFNRSTDGGGTWLPSSVRLDTGDIPGAGQSWYPDICCDGMRVYVVWFDERDGNSGIYFNRSLDGGETWLAADVRLDTPGATTFPILPRIACSGRNVYVTWMDDSLFNEGPIHFNRSHDAGTTWSDVPVRLNGEGSSALFPMVATSENYVYVAWIDLGSASLWDPGIRLNRSTDRGDTWLVAPVRVDDNNPILIRIDLEPPLMQCSGAMVSVVWRASRLGLPPGALRTSTQLLSRFGNRRTRRPFGIDLKNAAPSANPVKGDVYFNQSLNGGLTWRAEDTKLNTEQGELVALTMFSNVPSMAFRAQGDDFHVAWSANASGLVDVFFVHSGDRGVTWQTPELRLDTGDARGEHDSLFPVLSCSASNVFAAWMDDRNGDFDVLYSTTEAPPVADAGTGGETRTGRPFTLDGSGSSDPDRDNLSYLWILRDKPAGSAAVIDNHRGVSASFIPDLAGEYRIQLTVTDPFGRSDWQRIRVTALDLVDLTLTAGAGGTTRPAPGTHTCRRGETVTVTAVPEPGFLFSGWSGDAAGAANPLVLVMDGDKTVAAAFIPVVYPPGNLKGERIENRSLSMVEYRVRLAWTAHPDNFDIIGYRVMRVENGAEGELGVVSADTFVFEEAGVPAQGALTYRVYTLRADGYVSDPATVTVN